MRGDWQDKLYAAHVEKTIKAKGKERPVYEYLGHEYESKLEMHYAMELERQRMLGVPIRWWPHPCKLRLAKATTYTPDFLVNDYQTGKLTFIEVKGSWRAPHQEDSRVKIKMAAEIHKWASFVAATPVKAKDGGGWKMESF